MRIRVKGSRLNSALISKFGLLKISILLHLRQKVDLRYHRAIPMVQLRSRIFFVRQYKNSQAVAELQAKIFVKYDGKDASECANRELRGNALKYTYIQMVLR